MNDVKVDVDMFTKNTQCVIAHGYKLDDQLVILSRKTFLFFGISELVYKQCRLNTSSNASFLRSLRISIVDINDIFINLMSVNLTLWVILNPTLHVSKNQFSCLLIILW